jgi:hypothetical protein
MPAEMHCRVCGLRQPTPPRGESGAAPTYEICDCCGVEFGYEDVTAESARRFRQKWIATGLLWFAPDSRPPDWSWEEQQKTIPPGFV